MLVCPGGGYVCTSDREAEPIAMAFAAQGFHTFVLRYSVSKYAAFPNSLVELARTVKIIRENSEIWGIIADNIAVAGFSAGGHLTASLGVYWNDPEIQRLAGCAGEEDKPNALILNYPVITSGVATHFGSIDMLVQNAADDEERALLIEKTTLEKHVGKHTPPCFIMHTYFDSVVPVENSLFFAKALAEHNVPFELHIIQDGEHGLALADDVTFSGSDITLSDEYAKWPRICGRWLRDLFESKVPVQHKYESAVKRKRNKTW